MGQEKQTGTTVNNTTTTATPTAEETEMNRLLLNRQKATDPLQTQTQLSGLSLVNSLLQGQIPTSPLYQSISGVSPEGIASQATKLTRESLPGFQGSGLAESGVMQREISRQLANDLLYPAEQFNVGARQNMLNLALTGQAQVQSPVQANTNTLASSLAGLRSYNQSGTSQVTTLSTNPFMKSFQQGAGSSLGGGKFGNWSFGG